MKNPAVVLHEPKTVLSLGPAGMKSGVNWTQKDSDTLGHFIQVQGQIANSSWMRTKVSMQSCGVQSSGTFPDIESFVYVAVYFRQLFSGKDRLFAEACDVYMKAVESPIKSSWVYQEQKAWLANWTSSGFVIPNCTTEELFDAMLYGTHLVHSLPTTWQKHRNAFRDLFDNTPRERLLFEIHGSLRIALNYVSHVACVIYQDFAHWLNIGTAPRPDVMWHKSIFVTEVNNAPAQTLPASESGTSGSAPSER